MAAEHNFNIFGFRVLRPKNGRTELHTLAQHFKCLWVVLKGFLGEFNLLDSAELECVGFAGVRLRLATDVDFALVQDDHQRNSHARDVTCFADIGDEDFAAFVNRPQNYLEFFAGIFLEHGRGSRKKNSRIQVLSELFHGLFFVRRQAFLDFFEQIRNSLACGGVHVRNALQKHEMQHGIFEIRKKQIVRRFNCGLIKVGSSVTVHAYVGASINGGKEIHISLHIATLVFRNLQCCHQIVDGVGSARIRNQERKKLDGAFAAGNFCHNKPLKLNISYYCDKRCRDASAFAFFFW